MAMENLGFIDIAVAVMFGNLGTLSFVWGANHIHKSGEDTGLAWSAMLIPTIFIVGTIYLTEMIPLTHAAASVQ